MKVETVNTRGPYILIGTVPPSCHGNRQIREHEAGIHLLKFGMRKLGYQECEIGYEIFGKPYCSVGGTPKPLFLSISHSENLVACAISDQEIGCDIEKIKKVPQILDRELQKVRNITFQYISEESNIIRTQEWTIYEALGKYLGCGIPVESEMIGINNWNVQSWRIASRFILTVIQKKEQSITTPDCICEKQSR